VKLVFLGPPGAGKGTQAAEMADQFSLVHASTGDIFRSAVAGDSELGAKVRSYLDDGKLVPDELTSRVVGQMVLDRESDFILDGFPRTIRQAELLDEMLNEKNMNLDGVIYFQLEPEEAIERLTGRLVCSGCGKNYHKVFMPPVVEGVCDVCGDELIVRSDSSREIVEQRLEEYREKTKPLSDYYKKKGLLMSVDASESPADVGRVTQKLIKKMAGGAEE